MLKVKLNRTYFFAIILGLIATLWKYKFGVGDQLDHLLFVYKAMDAEFLSNDWYVNLASGFSVRYYFAQFIAFWSKLFGVEAVFFIFTLLSNIALSVSTFLVAKTITKNELSGLISSILVMTVPSINMGDFIHLFATGLAPDRLAIPLITFAFYYLIKNKLTHFAILAGLASIFHILFGFVVGSVLWFSFLTYKLVVQKRKLTWLDIRPMIILIIFSLFSIIPMVFSRGEAISSQEFLNIYVFFRTPHHIVPSVIFSDGIGLSVLCFFSGLAIILYLIIKKNIIDLRYLKPIGIAALCFGFICFLGYLFVEVFPIRFGAMLQAYRYLTFVKWLSYVLIGSYIGKLLLNKATIVVGVILLLSVLSPKLFVLIASLHLITHLMQNRWAIMNKVPYFIFAFLLGFFILRPGYSEVIILIVLTLLAFMSIYSSYKWFYSVVLVFMTIVGINTTLPNGILSKNKVVGNWFGEHYRPVFIWDQEVNSEIEMCLFIKSNLPENAKLVTPPDFAELGAVAHRAGVVTFKTVPFADESIKEWKKRIDFCYGTSDEVGFKAESELAKNYQLSSHDKMEQIQKKYAISYAIVPISTELGYPILHKNNRYKLLLIH